MRNSLYVYKGDKVNTHIEIAIRDYTLHQPDGRFPTVNHCSFCHASFDDWNDKLRHMDSCLAIKRNRDRLRYELEALEHEFEGAYADNVV